MMLRFAVWTNVGAWGRRSGRVDDCALPLYRYFTRARPSTSHHILHSMHFCTSAAVADDADEHVTDSTQRYASADEWQQLGNSVAPAVEREGERLGCCCGEHRLRVSEGVRDSRAAHWRGKQASRQAANSIECIELTAKVMMAKCYLSAARRRLLYERVCKYVGTMYRYVRTYGQTVNTYGCGVLRLTAVRSEPPQQKHWLTARLSDWLPLPAARTVRIGALCQTVFLVLVRAYCGNVTVQVERLPKGTLLDHRLAKDCEIVEYNYLWGTAEK